MKRIVDCAIIVVCCVVAFLLVFGLLVCMYVSADEPKIEMSENLSVMVMNDSFDVVSGKIKFTVMNWIDSDEARAVKQEEISRSVVMREDFQRWHYAYEMYKRDHGLK